MRFVPVFTIIAMFASLGQAWADSAYCPAPAGPYSLPSPPIGDVVLAEYNMRIDPGCSSYAPAKQKGGYYGLVTATRKMIESGMACLRKQGLDQPLRRLEALLKPGATTTPIVLVCGSYKNHDKVDVHGVQFPVTEIASALTPSSAGYPGVILSLDWLNGASAESFKAGMIHELFHAAGYDHTSSVDYAYFSAGCCFENSDLACNLLRRSVGKSADWWTSADYLKDAITWFRGRDGVASDLLLAAAAASPGNQQGVLAGLLQLKLNGQDFAPITDAFRQDLAVRCLAAGGGENCLKIYPTNNSAHTRKVGELVSLHYKLLARKRDSGSGELTDAERTRVRELRAGLNGRCADLTGGKKGFDQIRAEQSGTPTAPELDEALQSLCRP